VVGLVHLPEHRAWRVLTLVEYVVRRSLAGLWGENCGACTRANRAEARADPARVALGGLPGVGPCGSWRRRVFATVR